MARGPRGRIVAGPGYGYARGLCVWYVRVGHAVLVPVTHGSGVFHVEVCKCTPKILAASGNVCATRGVIREIDEKAAQLHERTQPLWEISCSYMSTTVNEAGQHAPRWDGTSSTGGTI